MFTKTAELPVNDTGLVVLDFLVTHRAGAAYRAGETAGFPPDEAARLIRLGIAVPHGTATKEVDKAARAAEALRPDRVQVPVYFLRRYPPYVAGETGLLGEREAVRVFDQGTGLPLNSPEAQDHMSRVAVFKERQRQIEEAYAVKDVPTREETAAYIIQVERLIREANDAFGREQRFIMAAWPIDGL